MTAPRAARRGEEYFSGRKQVYAGQCVYALFSGETMVYIGQSNIGERRVYQHQGKFPFDGYSIHPTTLDQSGLDLLEAELIVKYRPIRNRTLPTGQKKYCVRSRIKKTLGINAWEFRRRTASVSPAFRDYYNVEELI